MKSKITSHELVQHCKNLWPVIEKIVNNLGFQLFNLAFTKEHGTNYLRLTIEHREHLVLLDNCELTSKEVEKELDTKNLIPFSYILEVQSKGINPGKEEKVEHEFVLEKLGLTIKG